MTLYKALARDYFGWQIPVLSILDDPPGTPTEGDRHIVGTGTGAWVGKNTQIATYNGSGWDYAVPTEGWYVYNIATNLRMLFDGAAWGADQAVGEANTASNQGTDGVGVYDTKSGVDLQFRNIAPASSKISVTLNSKDIDLDVVEANVAHNSLSGYAAANHRAVNWSANQKVITIEI